MTIHRKQPKIFTLFLWLSAISQGFSSSVWDHSNVSFKSAPSLVRSPSASADRGRRITRQSRLTKPIDVLDDSNENEDDEIRLCSMNPVLKNLARGAFLRVASDISGGTPLGKTEPIISQLLKAF